MDDFPDFMPLEHDEDDSPIRRFEEMRANGAVYYFDVEEFEELIDYYLFDQDRRILNDVIHLAKSQHPDSIAIVLKEAETCVFSQNTAKAIQIVETIELFEDSNPEHYFTKASIYSMANRREKAIEVLYKLIEISDSEDLLEAKMALAKEFQELGEYHRSIALYTELLEENLDNGEALLELSLNYELAKEYQKGVEVLEQFIDDHPYSDLAWFSLGNLYLKLEEYEKSIESLEYAIIINDQFPEAYFNLGKTLMKLERYDDALAALLKSNSFDIFDSETQNLIGHCYLAKGMQEEAAPYFEKALDYNEDFAEGWLGQAIVNSLLDNYSEALKCVDRALEINPGNDYFKLFRAEVLFNLEEFEKSELAFEEAYLSAIDYPELYIDYAEVLIVNDNIDRASEILEEGISKYPDESSLYYRYAAFMLELGHLQEAESTLILALGIDPSQSDKLFEYYPAAIRFESIIDLIETFK